jgi:hypothetical protein
MITYIPTPMFPTQELRAPTSLTACLVATQPKTPHWATAKILATTDYTASVTVRGSCAGGKVFEATRTRFLLARLALHIPGELLLGVHLLDFSLASSICGMSSVSRSRSGNCRRHGHCFITPGRLADDSAGVESGGGRRSDAGFLGMTGTEPPRGIVTNIGC